VRRRNGRRRRRRTRRKEEEERGGEAVAGQKRCASCESVGGGVRVGGRCERCSVVGVG